MKIYRDIRACSPTAAIALFAAVALFTACDSGSIDGRVDETGVSPQFTANISAAATRAIDGTWNADEIGVTMTAVDRGYPELGTYDNKRYKTTATGSGPAKFEPASAEEAVYIYGNSGTVTFAAYAPYQETVGEVTVSDTKAANATAAGREAIDFIVAKGATCTADDPTVNFQFSHIMSKLVLQFKAEDASFSFADLTDAAEYSLSGLVHSGTVDLDAASSTFGTATASGYAAEWDITSCNPTDADEVRAYSFILFPQDASKSGLPIFVTISGKTFATVIYPNLKSGEETTYTLALKEEKLAVEGCTIAPWSEGTNGTGNAGVESNVFDLSTLSGGLTIDKNAVLTGTATSAVTISVNEGASLVVLKDAKFIDNSQIVFNTSSTLYLSGENTITTSSTFNAPILVQGGTAEKPVTLTITGTDADSLVAESTGQQACGIELRGVYSNLEIKGGNIEAHSRDGYAAGIGDGNSYAGAPCGNITISGGTVNASSALQGAGIGSQNSCGNITISGGTVTATGGYGGAGIGSGYYDGICGNITISGGTIKAYGGYLAAAIGTGNSATGSKCGSITISGGTIMAYGSTYAAAIGTGDEGICDGDITISSGVASVLVYTPYSVHIGKGNDGTVTGELTVDSGAKVGLMDGNGDPVEGEVVISKE